MVIVYKRSRKNHNKNNTQLKKLDFTELLGYKKAINIQEVTTHIFLTLVLL